MQCVQTTATKCKLYNWCVAGSLVFIELTVSTFCFNNFKNTSLKNCSYLIRFNKINRDKKMAATFTYLW